MVCLIVLLAIMRFRKVTSDCPDSSALKSKKVMAAVVTLIPPAVPQEHLR